MKKYLFILVSLITIHLIAITPVYSSDYKTCCVCEESTPPQSGVGMVAIPGTLKDVLPEGQIITDEEECKNHSRTGFLSTYGNVLPTIRCNVVSHSLCGKIVMEDIKEESFRPIQNIVLGIKIPNLRFSAPPTKVDAEGNIYIPWLGEYIKAIYNFSVAVISIVAVVVIIIAGAQIIVSAGGPAKSAGYKRITGAVIGLFIAWGSYVILYTINPNLTAFRSLQIQYIDKIPVIVEIDEPTAALPEATSSEMGVAPDFKQFDKKWADIIYGPFSHCTTIRQAGCGPTALAAILSAYQAPNATPDKVAAFVGIEGNGRVCNKGTNIDEAIRKLNQSEWNNFTGKKISLEQALEVINQKKSIIFLCSQCTGTSRNGTKTYNGGHYMVLTGKDDQGNIKVNDPGGNQNSGIILMTEEQLKANKGFWYVYPKE